MEKYLTVPEAAVYVNTSDDSCVGSSSSGASPSTTSAGMSGSRRPTSTLGSPLAGWNLMTPAPFAVRTELGEVLSEGARGELTRAGRVGRGWRGAGRLRAPTNAGGTLRSVG